MTGYEIDLYSLKSFPEESANIVETKLFQPLDTGAAEALQLLKDDVPNVLWATKRRDAWATFLTSLHMRMPEDLEILRVKWQQKLSDIEDSLNQSATGWSSDLVSISPDQRFDTQVAQIHVDLVRSKLIRKKFMSLHWACIDFTNYNESLYFSDRPILRIAALDTENGAFLLPIVPKRLFVAAANRLRAEQIVKTATLKDIKLVNRGIVGQASKYCYAVDDSPLRFMSNNFGKFIEPRPMLGT